VLIAGAGTELIVGRLLASGGRDREFGRGGWLRTSMGKATQLPEPSVVPAATLDAKGRLVVADPARTPRLPAGGVLLARYDLGPGR